MGTETTETKVTEFEDGSEIVETVTTETEYTPSDEPIGEAEVAPVFVEEAAPVSDAVAIAAIEADTSVQIAEIQAEVAIAQIEATQEERTWQEELSELRTNIPALIAEAVTAALASSQVQVSQLTPQPSEELAAEIAEEVAEAEATNNSIPPSTLHPTSETQTEVTLESGDEKPEAKAVVKVRRRLI